MLQVAIIGFGNIGKCAYEAVKNAPDMELVCIAEMSDFVDIPADLKSIREKDFKNIQAHSDIDIAIIGAPSRACPDIAETLLNMGICTVDSYDIHTNIWEVKCRLDEVAKKSGAKSIISAGWDPGSDSIIRALMTAMSPQGITYTNFGPGMSMGHSVAAKAINGVENALSITIPAGAGVHKRMVYVQLKSGVSVEKVTQLIKADPYFSHDETHVIQVNNINEMLDVGHGVNITRKGVSSNTHNQLLEYSHKINGPAVTAQILVGAARAVVKQSPGCYTLIEIPVIDMLPGDKENLIKQLV
ncbi:MAG: diaminopimelate dehydrogenase [Oscillospiraceae bacterium]|nr:diaminopimelate dehydrogenase [Oscillospiraceae bacterium]